MHNFSLIDCLHNLLSKLLVRQCMRQNHADGTWAIDVTHPIEHRVTEAN